MGGVSPAWPSRALGSSQTWSPGCARRSQQSPGQPQALHGCPDFLRAAESASWARSLGATVWLGPGLLGHLQGPGLAAHLGCVSVPPGPASSFSPLAVFTDPCPVWLLQSLGQVPVTGPACHLLNAPGWPSPTQLDTAAVTSPHSASPLSPQSLCQGASMRPCPVASSCTPPGQEDRPFSQ